MGLFLKNRSFVKSERWNGLDLFFEHRSSSSADVAQQSAEELKQGLKMGRARSNTNVQSVRRMTNYARKSQLLRPNHSGHSYFAQGMPRIFPQQKRHDIGYLKIVLLCQGEELGTRELAPGLPALDNLADGLRLCLHIAPGATVLVVIRV